MKIRLMLFLSLLLGLLCVKHFFGTSKEQKQPDQKAGAAAMRGQQHMDFAVSPAGDAIVFSAKGDGQQDIYLLDLKSNRVQRVTESKECEMDVAFSPDGKSILYSASASVGDTAHLFLWALADGKRQQLTNQELYDRSPAFSPDGSKIVFARAARRREYGMGGWTWDQWDICVMDANGGNVQQVTRENYYSVGPPQFSAKSENIIFAPDYSTPLKTDIFIIDSAGKNPPKALTKDGHSSAPCFSPDYQNIAFISDVATNYDYEVALIKADGTKFTQVTRNASYNQRPQYMPDGKHILFQSDPKRQARYDLWEVETDGSGLRLIADSSLFDDPMNWKPR